MKHIKLFEDFLNESSSLFYSIIMSRTNKKWILKTFKTYDECDDYLDEHSVIEHGFYIPQQKPIKGKENLKKFINSLLKDDENTKIDISQLKSILNDELIHEGNKPIFSEFSTYYKGKRPWPSSTVMVDIIEDMYDVDFVPDDISVYKKWPQPYRTKVLQALEYRKKNFDKMSADKLKTYESKQFSNPFKSVRDAIFAIDDVLEKKLSEDDFIAMLFGGRNFGYIDVKNFKLILGQLYTDAKREKFKLADTTLHVIEKNTSYSNIWND